MNKWSELLLGLILVIAAVIVAWYSTDWGAFWNFRHAAWELVKGAAFWVVVGLGVLFILLGISDLKGKK
jgi:peptidoglycan/LPS O-acetylase OafA/YrhL